MTLLDVYNNAVKPLPMSERLKLAAMILNDIPPESVVDEKTEWSDEDMADFSASAWNRLGRAEEPDHA